MVPLFPTMATEDTVYSNPRPISIQRLVPNKSSAQHHFKHLPAAQLQSVVQRAAADHQLEQTTRTLLQALNLQRGTAERTERETRPAPSHADLDKAHSDSEVSAVSNRHNNETSDSIQHLPTATTLLSEQATQTAVSSGGRSVVGQLPSLHLLRTLQARLASALQQVSELRAEGPWQGRVLDQPDWDRKLARMDEFHAKVTREMYILTRQVDLIMDSVCSVPLSRVTSAMKGDVIRKLVRAHRSALRVTQAFVQNYWDGSLDGRQAGRFLQLLTICRSLADICRHLDIRAADISDLPERLASLVRHHVTTAGDVGSLIREMALGRFGPAAAAERRRGQPAPRPGLSESRTHPPQRQHHKAKSAVDRLRALRRCEKLSVRSAPAVRSVSGRRRAVRPGSAPHAAPKVRPCGDNAPLPPLLEERDSFSSDEQHGREMPDRWSSGPDRRDHPDRRPGLVPVAVCSGRDRPDQAGDMLAATVEQAVRRALSGAADDPAPAPAPATAPTPAGRPGRTGGHQAGRGEQLDSRGGQTGDRRAATDGPEGQPNSGDTAERHARLPDSEGPASNRRGSVDSRERLADSRVQPASREDPRDSIRREKSGTAGRRQREAQGTVRGGRCDSRTRRQLRHVLARLDEMQRERDVIRRRWAPLIQARKINQESVYLDVELEGIGTAADSVPVVERAGELSRLLTGTADRQQTAAPHTDAATSTSTLTAPPPPAGPQRRRLQTLHLGTGAHRSVRDVFAEEALDPQLRGTLAAQLRGLLGSSDDNTIKSLPEATVHQLVDEFISEAGVDIFLHQLFDQEFELR